ncbi:MAG: hypothetical protein ACRYFX_18710 [Janthinobacterium lividum]
MFTKNGRHYASWACANMVQRLATEPHDTAPDGSTRFRYLPSVLELEGRGFVRLKNSDNDLAERWLMPAECKGGKRGRFYVDRFRGVLLTTRAYVCYGKADFEGFLAALAGVGEYASLHPKRCQKKPRTARAEPLDKEENIILGPGVKELVEEYQLKQFGKSIGSTLSLMCQRGTLIKYKPIKPVGKGPRVVYAHPSWLGPDGRPLPKYRERLEGYKRI